MPEIETFLPAEPQVPASGSRFARAHHILLYFLAAALVIWLLTGFYQVKSNEVAVVERLGQYVSNADGQTIEVTSGLHYHLPWPIDRVFIISNQQTLTLNVTAFNSAPAEYADFKLELQRNQVPLAVINSLFDPYLITADKSIINMQIQITYRVNDPVQWLTTVSHESDAANGESNDMRQQIFQHLAQRAMIHQVSHMALEGVLFTQRGELPQMLLETMQNNLQIWDASEPTGQKSLGIQILKVDVSELRPPELVRGAFDMVSNARQQQNVMINAAKADADKAKVQATGELDSRLAEARSYATKTAGAAQGEADRFKQILVQYHNAPDVTRSNIYVDAVRIVSGGARRIIFAQPGQKTWITVDPPQYDAGQVRPGQ